MIVKSNPTLRLLRTAAGLTQQQAAEQLGVSLDTQKAWESGRIVCPHAHQLYALAAKFGVPVDSLGFNLHNSQLRVPASDLSVPWDPRGALDVMSTMCHAGSVQRRIFTLLTGTTLTAPAYGWLNASAAQADAQFSDQAAGKTRVTENHVRHLDTITHEIRLMDDAVGGEYHLLEIVQSNLKYVTGLLREGKYASHIERRLFMSAAELLRLAGWMSFDTGRHAQAQHYWVAGVHAAHAAGDKALAAGIIGQMSDHAKEIRLKEAVPLAEAAVAGYKGTNSAVLTILHTRAAQAYAYSGDETHCQRSLDAAFEALDDVVESENPPDWTYWLSERATHFRAAGSYQALGQWQKAQEHIHSVLDAGDTHYVRDNALSYAMLATAQLGQGEVEQACHTAGKVFDLFGGDLESSQCRMYLDKLDVKLLPYRRHKAAKAFSEQLAHVRSHKTTIAS